MILVILAVGMFALAKNVEAYVPPQNPAEIAAVNIGDTVYSGDNVVSSSKIRKVPVIYHPEYLIEDIKSNQYNDFFTAITTGSVETPISQITSGKISRTGKAVDFEGPGMVTVSGNKLVVNPPETFVWGFKTPYTTAVKTANGINIVTQNKTVKTVSAADINNDTVPTNYVTAAKLKNWYNNSEIGDSIGLDYYLTSFNDGRNSITPNEIKTKLSNDTIKYMSEYPSGSPVMIYNEATNHKVVGAGNSELGYYAEYNNALRADNAKTFVQGWNGTIVPPHTSASGKEDVTFTGVYDPDVAGYPSHGACPPGRALRAAVMEAGCPLPSGMSSGYLSVTINANPSTGIKVYNPTNNPIKIVIWTVGSGTSMQIFAQAIQYTP
ncbi:MAG: hypothetical protein WAK14_00885 [Methanobacterium sp.]